MPNRDRHQGSKGAYLRIQFGEQEGVSYAQIQWREETRKFRNP